MTDRELRDAIDRAYWRSVEVVEPGILIRVTGPYFCAGCVARNGKVVEAAPILRRHVLGLDGRQFFHLCRRNLWHFEVVEAHDN